MIQRKINPFTIFQLPPYSRYRIKFRKFFLEDGIFSYGHVDLYHLADLYKNLTKGAADYVSPYIQYTLLSEDNVIEHIESLYTGRSNRVYNRFIEEIEQYYSATEILNLLYYILMDIYQRVNSEHVILLFVYSAALDHIK